MSIWDELPVTRDWDGLEERFAIWDKLEGITWRTLETGYVYTLPTIEAVTAAICFVGESFALAVSVTEQVEPEDGGEALDTGEPFTGTVTVSFAGVETDLNYDQETGLFSAAVPGPPAEAWSEDNYTFAGTVTAVNERGSAATPFTVVAHKAFPEIVSVSAEDSVIGESFILSAVLRIATVPAVSEGLPPFSGTASAAFQGTDYSLAQSEGELWTATLPSPTVTSWTQEGHVYAGTLTASMSGLAVSASFGARVRETTPPTVALSMPAQDIFLCNDCSPLWQWTVSDDASGVSHAVVTINNGAAYPAELYEDTVCWQMPVLPAGAYAVTVYVTDHDDNTASASKTVTGFPLIFDRTQADVERAVYINSLVYAAMTAEEKEEWTSDLKGAYNASDLNRVETATAYLAARCALHSPPLHLTVKTDWSIEDIPTAADMSRYLSNVAAIVGKFGYLRTQAPDYYGVFADGPDALPEQLSALGFDSANTIEYDLVYINRLIAWIECVEWYSRTHIEQTWEEVEETYPSWEDIDGVSWFSVMFPVVIEAELIPPWEVLPLETGLTWTEIDATPKPEEE